MISAEQNTLLTQVGPGTPGGNLMRHYWHPIALSEELDQLQDGLPPSGCRSRICPA